MKDERLVGFDLDELGQARHLLLHVDERVTRVGEDTELAVDVQVHRRRLDARRVEGVDDDASSIDLLADGAIGQDHSIGDATGARRR